MPDYSGLSQADWDEIADAVQEGFAFISVPVVFESVPAADKADDLVAMDPLYGESRDDTDDLYDPLPSIRGAVSYKPRPEVLTALGVTTNVDVMVIIEKQTIDEWEAANSLTFSVDNTWRFTVEGVTYDVVSTAPDLFPVDEGVTTTFISRNIMGAIKPRGA